ncbi:hypothetical protein MPER_01745, partial [Moniliophthora perniciosa FA553]
AALEKLHTKHVLPGFTDRTREEQEIEAMTTGITKACPLSSNHLSSIDLSFPNRISAAKNVQRGLAAKVQDLSATFRKKQRIYME